jgi:hypothetical protein
MLIHTCSLLYENILPYSPIAFCNLSMSNLIKIHPVMKHTDRQIQSALYVHNRCINMYCRLNLTGSNWQEVVCTYHRCSTKGCKQLSRKEHRRCPTCKKQVSLQEGVVKEMTERFSDGMEAMEAGDVDRAVALFCSYLDTMYRVGAPPYRDMSLCQDALRVCLSNSGNTWAVRKWWCEKVKFINLQVEHQTIQTAIIQGWQTEAREIYNCRYLSQAILKWWQ